MTVSVLQERSTDTSSSSSSLALAFSSNVTASSSIHTTVTWGDHAGAPTCSDSRNGSHTLLDQNFDNTHLQGVGHFNKDSAAAGSTTVTFTPSTSDQFVGIFIREIGGTSGIDGAQHVMALQSAPGTGANVISAGSLTPSVQPGLASVVSVDISSSSSMAVGTGFTIGLNNQFPSVGDAISEQKRYTATSAITCSVTDSTNGGTHNYGTVAALYKESGTAAAPFVPVDVNAGVTRKPIGDFAHPNLLTQQTLKLPPFTQKELPGWKPKPGIFTDFAPPNLLANVTLKLPPFTQEDLHYKIQWKGVYTDFAPPNLLADQFLPPPPVAAIDLSQQVKYRWSATDFAPPNLLTPKTLPLPPFTQEDLGQRIHPKGVYVDFSPPNLLSLLLGAVAPPVAPIDLSQQVKHRWSATDFAPPNLLALAILPVPPIAPQDWNVRLQWRGIFTDFLPENLVLNTLGISAPLQPQDISGIRLAARIVGIDAASPNLTLSTLAPPPPAPLYPLDEVITLPPRPWASDFSPPNLLTGILPFGPPIPAGPTPAGRHGTRVQARRRREKDVLRAQVETYKQQLKSAEQALIDTEDREVKARVQVLKRVKVSLKKPLEQYAQVKRAVANRIVATEQHRVVARNLERAQREYERLQEALDEEAALHFMHFLMWEAEWRD